MNIVLYILVTVLLSVFVWVVVDLFFTESDKPLPEPKEKLSRFPGLDVYMKVLEQGGSIQSAVTAAGTAAELIRGKRNET